MSKEVQNPRKPRSKRRPNPTDLLIEVLRCVEWYDTPRNERSKDQHPASRRKRSKSPAASNLTDVSNLPERGARKTDVFEWMQAKFPGITDRKIQETVNRAATTKDSHRVGFDGLLIKTYSVKEHVLAFITIRGRLYLNEKVGRQSELDEAMKRIEQHFRNEVASEVTEDINRDWQSMVSIQPLSHNQSDRDVISREDAVQAAMGLRDQYFMARNEAAAFSGRVGEYISLEHFRHRQNPTRSASRIVMKIWQNHFFEQQSGNAAKFLRGMLAATNYNSEASRPVSSNLERLGKSTLEPDHREAMSLLDEAIQILLVYLPLESKDAALQQPEGNKGQDNMVPDDSMGFFSLSVLVERHGIPSEKRPEKALARWRRKNLLSDDFIERTLARKNEPRFVYRESAILCIVEKYADSV